MPYGWRLYPDVLPEPGEPGEGYHVYAGQVQSWSVFHQDASPYGRASYRLIPEGPEEPIAVSMWLPEVFSACKVYVNGAVAELAAGRTALYAFMTFSALAIALFSLAVWAGGGRRDGTALWLAGLTLSFALRISYPLRLLHGVRLVGLTYALEDGAAMLGIWCALVLALTLSCLRRRVIVPITQLTFSAERFAASREVQKGLDIRTGDEVEALARALSRMEWDIIKYIDNLAAVTAEKERIGAELNVAAQIRADSATLENIPRVTEFVEGQLEAWASSW